MEIHHAASTTSACGLLLNSIVCCARRAQPAVRVTPVHTDRASEATRFSSHALQASRITLFGHHAWREVCGICTSRCASQGLPLVRDGCTISPTSRNPGCHVRGTPVSPARGFKVLQEIGRWVNENLKGLLRRIITSVHNHKTQICVHLP